MQNMLEQFSLDVILKFLFFFSFYIYLIFVFIFKPKLFYKQVAGRSAPVSLGICLVANMVALVALVVYQGTESGWAFLILFLYSIFAALVSPFLFLVSIVNAPRGTFQWGWPSADRALWHYRLCFWGNLAVVAALFSLMGVTHLF